jgi:signal transduction histidine kinase
VFRSLRFQLIAIVVGTVATVLATSQWLDTTLSTRPLTGDLMERSLLALDTVDALWGRPASGDPMAHTLAMLLRGNPEIRAIDLFRFRGDAPERVVTTRTGANEPAMAPAPETMRRLAAGETVTVRLGAVDGAAAWRVAVPIRRDGAVVGAAQADVSLARLEHFQHSLRRIDGIFLGLSVGLTSLALALFLERRVARPVASLVGGMRRAEAGDLEARVVIRSSREFEFLAGSLNHMLARIGELTTGLEARVRRATGDLAAKNRELEEANDKLWQAQLQLGRSERLAALGQMAATIAHELGTPLNSVLGYTQLLLRDDLRPEQAEKLAIVESQVGRMIETIRSVLDRTRDRPLGRTPIAVDAAVAEAVALVSSRLAGRRIGLRTEVPPELPPVPADAAGLRQILLNLLTNAIDATEVEGHITVRASVSSGNGRGAPRLEIVVADTGHGMTPETARRLFEPFYTTKEPGRGTGLGLAIVDHIVKAHGGQVVVETAPGAGTTMRVRLPLVG